jgi:putative effector of murein hydrolase
MGVLLGWWFGAEHMILMTMAPKSVTSPIAMLVAEQIGGVAALAAVFVLITGVIGAIFGPALLTRLGVHSPEARGMALGMTAHAVGTAVAVRRLRGAGDEPDGCGHGGSPAAGGVDGGVRKCL